MTEPVNITASKQVEWALIDTLMQLGDLFLHIDRHLDVVIAQYGIGRMDFCLQLSLLRQA